MFTSVDLFCLIFLCFAIWDGWRAGLLRSLLNPLFIAIFIPIGIINYDLNRNFAVASLVTIIGGLACANIIRLILLLSRHGVDNEFRRYVFWGSRLAGCAISALWKGLLLTVILLVILLLPNTIAPGGIKLQTEILRSRTFLFVDQNLLSLSPNFRNAYLLLNVLKNPTLVKKFSDTPEYHAFFDSKKVKDLLEDESVKSLLTGQHFLLLLRHPRVTAIITDDHLMYSLGLFARKICAENFPMIK